MAWDYYDNGFVEEWKDDRGYQMFTFEHSPSSMNKGYTGLYRSWASEELRDSNKPYKVITTAIPYDWETGRENWLCWMLQGEAAYNAGDLSTRAMIVPTGENYLIRLEVNAAVYESYDAVGVGYAYEEGGRVYEVYLGPTDQQYYNYGFEVGRKVLWAFVEGKLKADITYPRISFYISRLFCWFGRPSGIYGCNRSGIVQFAEDPGNPCYRRHAYCNLLDRYGIKHNLLLGEGQQTGFMTTKNNMRYGFVKYP